jgi:predicted lipoprotein with Yx(FWY)xxD motif
MLWEPMSRGLTTLGVLATLAFAACGDDGEATTAAIPETGAAEDAAAGAEKPDDKKAAEARKPAATGAEIKVADSQFGEILFDGDDRAIYQFDKETSSNSECYGACADAWPPVLTDRDPQAGTGADAQLLGTTERDDSSTQITYAGHPLYYYVDDPPGQVLCHGVDEFGGLWLVVEPSGEAVQ